MKTINIFDHWIGTFNRKGELMSVDETPAMATFASAALEIDPRSPRNRRANVTVIEGTALDFVLAVLDAAKLKVDEKRAAQIAANAQKFKIEEVKSEVGNPDDLYSPQK